MGTIKNMFQNHPVNIDIIGTESSINAITKEDLYTCYNTFYHPENMALFVVGNFDVDAMGTLIEDNQANKDFTKVAPIDKGVYDEPEHVATKESVIHLPVSIPKVTIGIKEFAQRLHGEKLLKRELFQTMILDYYFSPSGTFYEQLYKEELIDDSFDYSTNVEESFSFSMISSNTSEPEQFIKRVNDLLLSTKSDTISEEMFEIMKKKRIGQILRAMNSLEYVANQYVHYHFVDVDFFQMTNFIEQLPLDDLNTFLASWINEDRLTACKVESK